MPHYSTKLPSFVYFYAPWCSHCRSFTPIWDALEKITPQNNINMVKINCVEKNDYCAKINPLIGYPSLFYIPVKGNPLLYKGQRDPADIINFLNYNLGNNLIKI